MHSLQRPAVIRDDFLKTNMLFRSPVEIQTFFECAYAQSERARDISLTNVIVNLFQTPLLCAQWSFDFAITARCHTLLVSICINNHRWFLCIIAFSASNNGRYKPSVNI